MNMIIMHTHNIIMHTHNIYISPQYTDRASATLGAFAIQQNKSEAPREYYQRLRAAYFQGRNAPGNEEEHAFNSLFLHSLHESVRYDVTMYCRTQTMSMQEFRKYAQMAWETRARPTKGSEGEARVLQIQAERNSFALEDQEMPSTRTHVKNRFREQRRFGQLDRGVVLNTNHSQSCRTTSGQTDDMTIT
ncbi:hypothetical protein ILYODFUR_038006 [Ilyodon furcidens]|uniref:Retrotransposon gag domain-containing protein n=1 Tax=Ilyodon furcidens TaxID=33524 RepID=A0ABV0UNI7_9TELE